MHLLSHDLNLYKLFYLLTYSQTQTLQTTQRKGRQNFDEILFLYTLHILAVVRSSSDDSTMR